MGGGSGLPQRRHYWEVGPPLAWTQPACVLGLSNLQSQDCLASYSPREICYIYSHQRVSCFWVSLRVYRRLTFFVIMTLLPSLPPSLLLSSFLLSSLLPLFSSFLPSFLHSLPPSPSFLPPFFPVFLSSLLPKGRISKWYTLYSPSSISTQFKITRPGLARWCNG